MIGETLEALLARVEATPIAPAFLPQPVVEDWGPMRRGQGKRIGRGKFRMVMGAMSDAPRGKKTYHRMLPDAPETVRLEVNSLEPWGLRSYQRARSAGLSHDAAICVGWARDDGATWTPGVLERALREAGVQLTELSGAAAPVDSPAP